MARTAAQRAADYRRRVNSDLMLGHVEFSFQLVEAMIAMGLLSEEDSADPNAVARCASAILEEWARQVPTPAKKPSRRDAVWAAKHGIVRE